MLDKADYIGRFVLQLELECTNLENAIKAERFSIGGSSGDNLFTIEATRRCENLKASINLLKQMLGSYDGASRNPPLEVPELASSVASVL